MLQQVAYVTTCSVCLTFAFETSVNQSPNDRASHSRRPVSELRNCILSTTKIALGNFPQVLTLSNKQATVAFGSHKVYELRSLRTRFVINSSFHRNQRKCYVRCQGGGGVGEVLVWKWNSLVIITEVKAVIGVCLRLITAPLGC
jgi:hypothetical protein